MLEKGREKGYCGQYKYQMTVKEDGQTLLVFVDCGNDLQSIRNFEMCIRDRDKDKRIA